MSAYDIEELKKHIFIIVGIDHYNPLGIARSLGMHGIYPVLIVKKRRKISARIATASKYVSMIHRVDSLEDVPELLITKYSSMDYKPFVYSVDDVATQILDKAYDELKKFFYIQNCGKLGGICHYMRKEKQNEIALRSGLKVAKTWDVSANLIPHDIEYPVITKPFESYEGWKKDYYVCNNESELKQALKNVKGKVFVQQYIQKVNELCIDGYTINHGNDNIITIASRYTYILPDCYSMEMIVSNFDNDTLTNCINKMFKEIQYEGIYCMEFLEDNNGSYWFLEINFRNSGWSWASTCVGMNLPLLWASSTLTQKKPSDYRKIIPSNYIALDEIGDFEQRVIRRKMISLATWYKSVKNANCLYYYDKNDKRPAISMWSRKIINILLSRG